MSDDLADRWAALLSRGMSNHHELDPEHPVRIIYGSDDAGLPLFFFITNRQPPLPEIGDAVGTERGRRDSDGRWTLSLVLKRPELFGAFVELCNDLARRTRELVDEQDVLREISRGIDEWRELFAAPRPARVTEDALRGFVAELYFAFVELTKTRDIDQIVLGWAGPLGGSKDFLLPDGDAFEVKSVHSDATRVRISSAEQLDPGRTNLHLVVVTLESAPSGADTVSVRSLVDSAEALVADHPATRNELQRRVLASGIDLADPYYDESHFRIVDLTVFRASHDEFPAIRRPEIPDAIDQVSYSVLLRALAPFALDPDALSHDREAQA